MRWLLLPLVCALLLPASAARAGSGETRLWKCANRLRADHDLPKLRYSGKLATAARRHARRMARRGFFDHVDDLGRQPWDRIVLLTDRFSAMGENIAAGRKSARSACRGWFRSPAHRANVLSPSYTHIGAGMARGGRWGRYFVQDFGGV